MKQNKIYKTLSSSFLVLLMALKDSYVGKTKLTKKKIGWASKELAKKLAYEI